MQIMNRDDVQEGNRKGDDISYVEAFSERPLYVIDSIFHLFSVQIALRFNKLLLCFS